MSVPAHALSCLCLIIFSCFRAQLRTCNFPFSHRLFGKQVHMEGHSVSYRRVDIQHVCPLSVVSTLERKQTF